MFFCPSRICGSGLSCRKFGFGHAGYVHAVDGVSFDLHNSEAIAVVGESGCGKSSLMKTILGLYRPTQGKMLFEGKNVGEMNITETESIPLPRWLYPAGPVRRDGAVYERRAHPGRADDYQRHPFNRAERMERIHRAMEEVKVFPVDDFLPKFPHQLSGGQQQRIVIARAMLLEPELHRGG